MEGGKRKNGGEGPAKRGMVAYGNERRSGRMDESLLIHGSMQNNVFERSESFDLEIEPTHLKEPQ